MTENKKEKTPEERLKNAESRLDYYSTQQSKYKESIAEMVKQFGTWATDIGAAFESLKNTISVQNETIMLLLARIEKLESLASLESEAIEIMGFSSEYDRAFDEEETEERENIDELRREVDADISAGLRRGSSYY